MAEDVDEVAVHNGEELNDNKEEEKEVTENNG